MANRPSSLLPDIDIPDPMDTAAEYQSNIDKGLASNNYTSKGAAFGNLLGRAMNGGMDPATQKAAAEQGAVKETLSNLQPQQDHEDDLTYQLRQAHAIYNTVAPMDTNLAMKAMDRIATLSEAKTQQARLQAETAKESQESDIRAVTQGTIVLTDGSGNNLGLVHRFQDDGRTPNPQFGDQLRKGLSDHPGSFPVTSEKFENDKANLAFIKGQEAFQLQQYKTLQANQIVGGKETLIPLIEAYAAQGNAAFNRLKPEERDAARRYYYAMGLRETDFQAAQGQIAALRAAGVAAGRRDGNLAYLQNSIPGLGQAVITAGQHVSRDRLTYLNDAIIGGKLAFSDPNETRYATAVNSLVTEYARLMSGATGQTHEGSRLDAKKYLPTDVTQQAMAAAVDQMANVETPILKQAGDQTLEVLANPKRYSALMKVQEALDKEAPGRGVLDRNTIEGPDHSAAVAPAVRPGQGPASFASEAAATAANLPDGTPVVINGVKGTWRTK